MNPDGGYTRQYRRIWDHPVFRNKQEAAVFSWMKDAAQWKEGRISTKYGPVTLGVGELLIAERVLAEDFGMHRNTMRNLIQRMVDDGMITLFRDRCPQNAGTVVRVMNYKEYQGLEGASGPQEDRSRTTSGTTSGPQEDRSRTKNKEGNQGKELRDSVEMRAQAPEPSEPEIGSVFDLDPVSVATTDPDPVPEDTRPAYAVPAVAQAAPAASPQPVTPPWRRIIQAFDAARIDVFGEHMARMCPAATDRTYAERWLSLGADEDICRDVFVKKFNDAKRNCRSPPDTLRYCDKSIEDHVAERNAIQSKPFEGKAGNVSGFSNSSGQRRSAHASLFEAGAKLDALLG